MKGKKTTKSAARSRGIYTFAVVLKLDAKGPEVAREPIRPEDTLELQAEAWLDHLRDGNPDLPFSDLAVGLLPVYRKGNDTRCGGLIVESVRPDGEKKRHFFSIQVLAHVAQRAAKRLIDTGILTAGQGYFYEVVLEPREGSESASGSRPEIEAGEFKVTHHPLVYEKVPLPPLLKAARPVGEVNGWIPVLYSYDLFLKMEKHARRGADVNPPVESGAVILGSLCSCPETGEFFVAATDVIELIDAEQTSYSLSFSGKTWARIQAVVKARQSDPATPAIRIVGQCHGHNFLPGARLHEGNDCNDCPSRSGCGLTSVFVSASDSLWTRSVFTRQPWAFCHIFGLDARGGPIHAQFGFQGGGLVRRGFYLINDLGSRLEKPGSLETKTETVLAGKEEG